MQLKSLAKLRKAKTGRKSSWDTRGRNSDFWIVPPGKSRVLAEIEGPGCITPLWLTQRNNIQRMFA
jgi:hypothetical protein